MLKVVNDAETSNGSDPMAGQSLPDEIVRDGARQMLATVLRVQVAAYSDAHGGGIHKEAPTFRVPVLVLREVTERTEAVDAGCALLLGTDRARIVSTAAHLLDDEESRARLTGRGNPFGDGMAALRRGALARAVRPRFLRRAQCSGAGKERGGVTGFSHAPTTLTPRAVSSLRLLRRELGDGGGSDRGGLVAS